MDIITPPPHVVIYSISPLELDSVIRRAMLYELTAEA